jgi:hypothetical protein
LNGFLMPRISLKVDRSERAGDVDARLLLIHYLRDRLGVTAATSGCDTDPPETLDARPPYRRHLAAVLTGRALAGAGERER